MIAKSHLYIQTGKDVLFGFAKTPEQFAETYSVPIRVHPEKWRTQ